jgi:trimeric autotransporter adhesin
MNFLSVMTLLISVVFAFATTTVTASLGSTASVNSHGMHQQATNGIISTAAGKWGNGIAVDSTGDYYIGDSGSNIVRKVVASTGIITTIAGDGRGFSGDGGSALTAKFNTIQGIAVDINRNLYIADYANNRIRKITASTGIVSTIAGTGDSVYENDGILATTTTIGLPSDVAVDTAGNVYIVDTANGRIRKITASTGIISTVAGGGSSESGTVDGILATKAYFTMPKGVALDSAGNIYFTSNTELIKKVTVSTGIITTVGGGGKDLTVSGIAATTAKIDSINRIAIDKSGNIFFGEFVRIRQITVSTGIISLECGSGEASRNQGGGGLATEATVRNPEGIAVDLDGNLLFCEKEEAAVRKITFAGSATTPSSSTTSSPTTAAPTNVGATKAPASSSSSAPVKTPSSSAPGTPTTSMSMSPSSNKSASIRSTNTISAIVFMLVSLPLAFLW